MWWMVAQWLSVAMLAFLMGWAAWRYLARPGPVTAAAAPADPFAGQVAEFARELGDWCRG